MPRSCWWFSKWSGVSHEDNSGVFLCRGRKHPSSRMFAICLSSREIFVPNRGRIFCNNETQWLPFKSPPFGPSLLFLQREQAVRVEVELIPSSLLGGEGCKRKMGKVNVLLKLSYVCTISVIAVSLFYLLTIFFPLLTKSTVRPSGDFSTFYCIIWIFNLLRLSYVCSRHIFLSDTEICLMI